MSKILFIYLLVILFGCSCGSHSGSNSDNDYTTIDFESSLVDKLKFSQFVDTIEFIPLETTDENLIGEIQRIIYDDEKYYIRVTRGMQNANLLVFDKKGKYLWGLNKRGNGPGEYNDFKDFLLTKERINVVSYFKFISYDRQGGFKEEYKLEQHIKEFLNIDDTTFLVYNFRSPKKVNTFLNKMNDKGKVKEFFFERKENEAKVGNNRINWRSLIVYGDFYYLNYPYIDTIFQIEHEQVHPFFYIDYGDKKIPENLLKSFDDIQYVEKALSKSKDYMLLSSFGLSEHYVYIGSINKTYQAFLTLYSRKTGKTLSARKIEDDLYLKGMFLPVTSKMLPHNSDNGDILWEVEPSYLIEGYRKYMSNLSEPRRVEFKSKYPDLVKMCTTLKEDDNPVLLRIKVKEF